MRRDGPVGAISSASPPMVTLCEGDGAAPRAAFTAGLWPIAVSQLPGQKSREADICWRELASLHATAISEQWPQGANGTGTSKGVVPPLSTQAEEYPT